VAALVLPDPCAIAVPFATWRMHSQVEESPAWSGPGD
jgi:hypothetical protein